MESIGPERWEKKDEDESRFIPFYHVTQHVKVNALNGRRMTGEEPVYST